MTMSLHTASIPIFKQMLNALREILQKADAHASAHKIDPNVLLNARLYPDMFPLLRQVQIAADFARGIAARLSESEVPSNTNSELNFVDLIGLIEATNIFLDGITPAHMAGAETREIVLRPGTLKEKRLSGSDYLLRYGLPQFFFHLTTSYAILRHNGLDVGKRDYMGAY
jgi:uncharacterized protein